MVASSMHGCDADRPFHAQLELHALFVHRSQPNWQRRQRMLCLKERSITVARTNDTLFLLLITNSKNSIKIYVYSEYYYQWVIQKYCVIRKMETSIFTIFENVVIFYRYTNGLELVLGFFCLLPSITSAMMI